MKSWKLVEVWMLNNECIVESVVEVCDGHLYTPILVIV